MAKITNPTRFGASRPWPAKNGLGQVGPPLKNGLDTITRPTSEQACRRARHFFFKF